MFATRIASTANHLGYRLLSLNEITELPVAQIDTDFQPMGEPLLGPDAILINKLTDLQPSLIIFDLDLVRIPWRRLIATLKSSPATRRIPVLCYGPHIDKEKLELAKNLSADGVVARSRFSQSMPQLIEQYARQLDNEAIAKGCDEPLSDLAREGLVAFNKGLYFESHEYLEDAWNEDNGPAKELYRAVLQIAVAYLQIERANYRGAIKMFLRARQWLSPLPDFCRGINITQLISDADLVHKALLELGPEGIHRFEFELLKPIQYQLAE
jgi:predicted metal-dependent hydrolase